METTPLRESKPALWNPTAAALWSVVFTPAFGAFFHAKNAVALGRDLEARSNRSWFGVSLAYLIFTLIGDFVVQIPDAVYSGAAVGLLIGWYFSLGRKQVDYVSDDLLLNYARKSWVLPLVVGFTALVCFFVIAFALQPLAESAVK